MTNIPLISGAWCAKGIIKRIALNSASALAHHCTKALRALLKQEDVRIILGKPQVEFLESDNQPYVRKWLCTKIAVCTKLTGGFGVSAWQVAGRVDQAHRLSAPLRTLRRDARTLTTLAAAALAFLTHNPKR